MKTIYKKLLFLFLLLPFTVLAQSTLKGTVADLATGQPIPGVNVNVQGAPGGTSTDFDGKFQLSNLKNGDKINVSFIGYKTSTVTYNGQQSLTVSLEEDNNQLKEVVVQVGYGTVKKKDATGSVSQISAKEFNKGINVTPESLISGRIAGVNVVGGGAPGAKADIRIRGGSSLSASNEPLIVIDGLPMSNAVPNGSTSILSTIDPNDIESFTVLKDASAAAIYGSRAANGVIVITTKKGTKGGVKVNFNSQVGINTVANTVDVLSADQFRALVNEKGNAAQKALLGTANTNWQNEIFHTALTTNNNISVSGALFNKLPVRLSVGNVDNPGILRNTSFERTTTSLSLNPVLFDNHLKIDISGNLAFGKNQFQDEGPVIGSAISFDPTQSVYQTGSRYAGYFEWLEANGNVPLLPARNPVARLNQDDRRSTSTRKWGNIRLDYKLHFFEDLRVVVEGGIDKFNSNGYTRVSNQSILGYQPEVFSSGKWVNLGGDIHYTDSRQNKNLNTYFNYTKDLGKFKIDATAGYNYQLFQRVGYDSGQTKEPNPKEDVTTDPDINLQSYFGRLTLNYDSRYLLTLNYRRDGTSRFAKENRWGNFGGAAFAWNVAQEEFLKDNETLSSLKLRVGYGTTGQQDIVPQYDYLRRVTLGTINTQYLFNGVIYKAARPEGYNPDIKWEDLAEMNVGVDFGFFKDRITGTVNYFDKKSSDLLAEIAYPDGANIRNQGYSNIGSVRTKGVEFNLQSDIIKNDKLTWNLAVNATYIDQKITDLGTNVPGFQGYITGDIIAGGTGNQVLIHSAGFAPNSFFVFEQLYDANKRPIQGAYADRNGDGAITDADRYKFHKPTADYTFGLYSTLNYKKFDFTMNWRASLGNYIYDNVSSDKGYLQAGLRRDSDLSNISTDYYNTGFTTESNSNGTQRNYSDYFVKDASFIKLDNVVFGYTFDKTLLKAASLRFTVGVQNVFVLTKYDGLDPEKFNGIDNNVYPRARTFLFGVNANF
ncbi:SusC/RagA family TonB-linked outer membrane protein [Flavobacterium hibernum]|uniref:SusC/RagA family TonB-linked outer membrane protein n=1 Tax=Flavobacterium hibernum TaxID=37752 RepID=A0A0D0EMK2_9FLAO|nr:TonB-dependent receptor [Flavobacterium hibernum]KIO53825.1 TonB-dependent receptor [Flavobacterium hibernum]OXA90563.1 SusC/RagA family TonB-linked outer membrane protein [Flavobacterium hibernum]PTT13348.1 TonB-dependent receptor [Flavobacterium sp. HMWF030]STO14839.1 Outer membrane cobalamin receptor protein [Flavobacterium hibernum]